MFPCYDCVGCCVYHDYNEFELQAGWCHYVRWDESNFESQDRSKCFVMMLQNLANPIWHSIDCSKKILQNVICIRDKITQHTVHISNTNVESRHFCASNAFLVLGNCYDFLWNHGNTNIACLRENFKVNIMIFKHIFEVIALEDRHLSAFVKYNIKTMSSITFIRYLNTVSFDVNIASLSDAEGYIICHSKKNKINLGTHIFNCSGGSNILSYYICDGTVDCPNDKSDEDGCSCNESKNSKMCKTINYSQNFSICFSTYYIDSNGKCLKYTSPNKIYQAFNIYLDVPAYKVQKTSKLTAYDESATIFQQNNKIHSVSTSNFKKDFTCLNKGQVPCREVYFKCYNLSSLCIYQLSSNQNLIPCENGIHLQQCKTFLCDIMFKCLDNYCIPWSYVCDGKWDCPKGDDELGHSVCNKTTLCLNIYHCRNTNQMCLHLGNTCDGYHDCPFGDDELLCELKSLECPSFCVCLLYAIYCRMISDNNVKVMLRFPYLFVHFSNFKLNLENPFILSLTYATVVNLQKNDISDVCDAFNKVQNWKCILLDLSFNLLKSIENKCFSNTKLLKSLALNDNDIKSVGKKSFHDLSNLRCLNLTNNPILHLHNHLIFLASNLKILSIMNISFKEIDLDPFYSSKINFLITKDYHLCCTAPSGTICTAFQHWFISCSDILPLKSMKSFFTSFSILIIVLNSASIIFQLTISKLKNAFSVIVLFINANDILCGIYLSFIWIADLVFSGKFHVKESSWRAGFLCLAAFTTAIWFTILSELGLIFMSIARLMVTISPLYTRFKEKVFVIKSLSLLFVFSALSSILITIIFKYMEVNSTISLCLPFVDPSGSQLLIKLITWFTVTTQFATSVGIMIMHILLICEVKHYQNITMKVKSRKDSNVNLIIQLVLITTSNILCWFPAGCIYISAMFLSTYPIDLVIWTTVIGLPINSIVNPSIFIVTTFRKL